MPLTNIEYSENADEPEHKKQSFFLAVFKRLRKDTSAMIGLYILLFMLFLGLFAPLIAPYHYAEANMSNAFAPPSWEHICGTDRLGRDIFSRLLYGTRYSAGIGFFTPMIFTFFGVLFGSIAGYYGGKVDNIIMRIMDVLQPIPPMLMAIIVSASLGGGFFKTVFALGIGGAPAVTRLMRSSVLTVREQEYLEAARSMNCPAWLQIIRHVLPNSFTPLLVNYTMSTGVMILAAASLSYIGLGIQPPTPEWGAMISEAKEFIRYYPHMIIFPGFFLAVLVFALNMFGDGLRDALDPKMKK